MMKAKATVKRVLVSEAKKLRKQGYTYRGIEVKLFGRTKSTGSWAYHVINPRT